MEVTTRNINFVKFLNSSSTSVYTPNKENGNHTDYQITIKTSAFREFSIAPPRCCLRLFHPVSLFRAYLPWQRDGDRALAKLQRKTLGMTSSPFFAAGESNSWVRMGGVARALEEFVSKKLMGNVKKGEETVKNWAATMRKACMLGSSNSRLCRDLVGEWINL
jgi:hypothetical protein